MAACSIDATGTVSIIRSEHASGRDRKTDISIPTGETSLRKPFAIAQPADHVRIIFFIP